MNKILFVTAFPPNEKTAGQYYTLRLLQDLKDHDFDIDLIYFDYREHKIDESLNDIVINNFKISWFSCFFKINLFPLFTKRFRNSLKKYLKKISDNYDILYFDFSQTFIYSLGLKHNNIILMCHDIISQKYKRKNLFLYLYSKSTEKKMISNSNKIYTFSKKDSDLLFNYYNKTSKNINFYLRNLGSDSINPIKNRFCFFGAWNRKENYNGLIWFCNKVLPFINGNIEIIVIGNGLNNIDVINNKRIEYLGFVEDPLLEIIKSQALIAPVFSGAGVKVKVIDSLSTGTPVIGTDIAFEGIKQYDDISLLANDSKDFISIINNWKDINNNEKKKNKKMFIDDYKKNYFIEDIISN